MKIGIISFAHMHAWSYAHCIIHNPLAELIGIADEDVIRGKRLAEEFGTQWHANYNDLLALDLDAVIICSENSKHAEISVAAAKAGKHILCEKPIATTIEEGLAMIHAAEANNVKLMIAFPCRYHDVAIRMKEQVTNGEFGEIIAINGTNRGTMPGGWFIEQELSGGGAIMDHTVHVLDVMRWLMPGSEVKEVYAEADTLFHDIDADDSGLLTFEFDNGVIASLDPSWSKSKSFPTWGDLTIEIIGTKGSSRIDLYKQAITLHSDDTMKTTHEFWCADADQGLIDSFIDCVVHDLPSPITGWDGLRAMEVALYAYRSSKEKQPLIIARTERRSK
ncbi:gfo/Idh/MocA family oxidoreductase [Paenibacillus psychroresistens]|uniref:Gfo/Idh/MocA family oxidoreductase n=1 Tax=Paenibacillus psychroresistens TaxID=1778678 RepID=A0A6B8RG98_9BACL|nr:Gfo/Idh/MocA family oxidoreductase [Paenibacillus psychroresistens]QGQ95210.1 gfo/Idh/MocA family oxidoreductase [Paenibacillus psychroresistens]